MKRAPDESVFGALSVINLLGPRPSVEDNFWARHVTHTQLKVEFVSDATGMPHRIGRTFLTFFDLAFDTTAASSGQSTATIELGPQATMSVLAATTDVVQRAQADLNARILSPATAAAAPPALRAWPAQMMSYAKSAVGRSCVRIPHPRTWQNMLSAAVDAP